MLGHHYHHHKHQGLDPLIRSVSTVTTALANVSSDFQFFSFLVVFSDMISKGFGLVAFFASVKASSVCIHLSCLVCIQSAVHGVRSRLFCGHEGCSLPEVSITSFLPLQFFVRVKLSKNARSVYIHSCELFCGLLFRYISKNQMLYRFNYDVIVLIIFKVCSKFQTSSVSQIES
jgi:hypothetical protein